MKINGQGTFNAVELGTLNQGDCFVNMPTGGLFMKLGPTCATPQQIPKAMCLRLCDGDAVPFPTSTMVNEIDVELNWRYK
jgi:hypothetical protein